MIKRLLKLFFLFIVVFKDVSCASTEDINALVQKYEADVNATRVLNRNDRKLMRTWSADFQVRRLDVSMKYRTQMLKHMEHNFKTVENTKWLQCVQAHGSEIKGAKRFYHESERECLRQAASSDLEKRQDIEQLEKEIAKWRKGYRYLVRLCGTEHPGDQKSADKCLVENMQNDNYDQVIQRLMTLKLEAVSDLYGYFNNTVIDLEECLKTYLSRYLERVRGVMGILDTCYKTE